jgi:hypothetical protein
MGLGTTNTSTTVTASLPGITNMSNLCVVITVSAAFNGAGPPSPGWNGTSSVTGVTATASGATLSPFKITSM